MRISRLSLNLLCANNKAQPAHQRLLESIETKLAKRKLLTFKVFLPNSGHRIIIRSFLYEMKKATQLWVDYLFSIIYQVMFIKDTAIRTHYITNRLMHAVFVMSG